MRFFRYMWYGESLDEVREELYGRLTSEKPAGKEFVLVLPEVGKYLMDIIPVKDLGKSFYKDSNRLVIGAAGSPEEAQELAGSIIGMVYNKTGTCDVNAYLSGWEDL